VLAGPAQDVIANGWRFVRLCNHSRSSPTGEKLALTSDQLPAKFANELLIFSWFINECGGRERRSGVHLGR